MVYTRRYLFIGGNSLLSKFNVKQCALLDISTTNQTTFVKFEMTMLHYQVPAIKIQ
jgi:hypothetical protein